MKIHMLGHASIVVETQDCRILMDPVLWDPFCEGLNESCPQRNVFPEQLAALDVLIISHQHLDHFDIRSLAYLPKQVDVFIPHDPLIQDCLHQLGYRHVYPLSDFTTVKFGSTSLTTTRSEIPVPEFGVVFADPSGIFWNTVDTLFAPSTIQAIRQTYPTIDFLLATWMVSMEGRYQSNQPLAFPFELYGSLFNLMSLIEPKAIAPGAQGFKYVGSSAWQNQVVFPVSRERFCHDLKTAFPELESTIFCLDPGDVLTLEKGKSTHQVGQSHYVTMTVDDRECVEFSPVKAGNPLIDTNPDGYELTLMSQVIEEELTVHLPEFIHRHRHSLFRQHCIWNVIYEIEVVFPDGAKRWWFDFSKDLIQTQLGRQPLANLLTCVTASDLYSLMVRDRDWDYLYCSGNFRTFHTVYSMTRLGISSAEGVAIPDPVQIKFPSGHVAGNNLHQAIAQWATPNASPAPEQEDGSMIKLGNLLIKRRDVAKARGDRSQ